MPHKIPEIQTFESPSGLTVYHCGPALNKGPLPAFFYFALSGHDSLALDPFNQPIQFLADAPIRCFSFTIPGHGPGFENTKAMQYWARALSESKDIITPFIEQCCQTITYLIEQGLVDPNHLAVGGLSRGAFIATHIAARHPQINIILGFAPLTLLTELEAFKEISRIPIIGELPIVAELNVDQLIPLLLQKKLRYYIGNRDTLVSTDACYNFIRTLAEKAYEQRFRPPAPELMIFPSIGYHGHGTAPHVFKAGIEWLKTLLTPSP